MMKNLNQVFTVIGQAYHWHVEECRLNGVPPLSAKEFLEKEGIKRTLHEALYK
jgi:hypothetical protein